MSVLIKGMEMPTNCVLCRMSEYHVANPYCKITEAKILRDRDRNNDCPLAPVPPHGRLIDADAAAKRGWTISRTYSASPTEMVYEARTMTDEVLPTIIESEEKDERTD